MLLDVNYTLEGVYNTRPLEATNGLRNAMGHAMHITPGIPRHTMGHITPWATTLHRPRHVTSHAMNMPCSSRHTHHATSWAKPRTSRHVIGHAAPSVTPRATPCTSRYAYHATPGHLPCHAHHAMHTTPRNTMGNTLPRHATRPMPSHTRHATQRLT